MLLEDHLELDTAKSFCARAVDIQNADDETIYKILDILLILYGKLVPGYASLF